MRNYLVLGCYEQYQGIYAIDISASSPEDARRKALLVIDEEGISVTLRCCFEVPADSPYHDIWQDDDEEEEDDEEDEEED